MRDLVLKAAKDLGFARVGICDAEPTAYKAEIRTWLSQGQHGSMHYLQERLEERLDPGVYVPGARSIICVADRYSDGRRDRIATEGGPRGRIARYARGRDYHKVLKKRLVRLAKELGEQAPHDTFRVAVDTAPLLEREHAARAGLGLIGKHTLLIEPGVGSWMLLGAIVTTASIDPTPPAFDRSDPCGSCTRCIDVCPTSAITPFAVDGSRCIAYTSIENRGSIDETIAEATGSWLFGCDLCQEVCPHGPRPKRRPGPPLNEAYASDRSDFDLLEVLDWDKAAWMEALLGTAAKRATLAMWKRNAIICLANWVRDQPDNPAVAGIRARLKEIAACDDEEPMVREHAARAL
jgi:epoxyqueuosine reductase